MKYDGFATLSFILCRKNLSELFSKTVRHRLNILVLDLSISNGPLVQVMIPLVK